MKILQIFSRYLEYGGEESCVQLMDIALKTEHEVTTYYSASEDIIHKPFGKFQMPFLMQKNDVVLNEIGALQEAEHFDFWLVHNVFPAVSVALYELAAKLGVPVVQYLHNHRLACLSAIRYRNGSYCADCSPSNFLPGVWHGCWRGSNMASLAMAAALRRFWVKGGYESIRGYIALSEEHKREHIKMGIPANKIQVVPHFMKADVLVQTSPPVLGDVLFIGRLSKEKGVDRLLDAWSRVDTAGRALRILGDGPELSCLKAKVVDLKLNNVIFEGFVQREHHQKFWENASFCIAPSPLKEPFGMVVLECWRQGRPILATNLGSFPEMIADGVNGWLAPSDGEGMSVVLERALRSGDAYASMGNAGRLELETKYDQQTWLKRMNEVYKEFGLVTAE